ncbi:FAD:protein FMN transferase [Leptotrichia sp. oral taxon 223]|uniref:FAD:protein FMN transferase n=1 Tax=Leptotrichia sp. oral taxon 223 TaxID=712363 RepID=UPI0015B8C33D|nr:FAD:protein FMN transferase [Leptotrichia sp. oral taxon 223]NWO19666.1 FAD:protein FMN transferase [Leptotrichia sp. oral taxon 223]
MMYKVQVRFLFHSDIKIKIPEIYDDSVFDRLFGILEDVNEKYNSYAENSYIDKINKNSGHFVRVDDETINILSKIIHLSNVIGGEYDITIMPLIRLWGFYKQNPILPPLEEIKKARKLVDYKKIIIDKKKKRVKIEKSQEIITGSFIKAYAIEKIAQEMRNIGIKDAIVNAGGSSIIAIDEWGIIVENPEEEREIIRNEKGMPVKIAQNKYTGDDKYNKYNDLFEIKIKNKSYSTSNQKNTYLLINNKKYGHIISPKTGFPSQNKQVGVITENAFFGDIISTGLYNQTPHKFYEIMEKLSEEMEISGFLIDKEGRFFYFNMEKYF